VISEVLVFAYFKGHGDGLHLAVSSDGYSWKPLHHDQPVLLPAVGIECIMRDPCIVPGADGKFHLVWTIGWNERGIGYAYSKDLVNWSEQVYLPVMEHEPKTRNCWAPEILFYEKEQLYIIYWSSTIEGLFPETQLYGDDGYNHRIFYVTTPDFHNFSETRLLYDPGFNAIDANIVRHGDDFLIFLKNETLTPPQKNLRMARGKTPFDFGPCGHALTLNHYWAEGPTAIYHNGEWLVYFDKYKINEIGAIRSKDLKTWEDVSDQLTFPKGAQHGYVFRASATVVNAFQQHLPIRSRSIVNGM
jgi:hypothetical protein